MTAFNDKEKAAENKYAHDKEQEFRIHARRNRMLGLWAAAKMGLAGQEAEKYAESVLEADMEKPGQEDVFEKVKHDLLAHDLHISDHDLRAEMHNLLQLAREQVAKK